MSFFGALYEHFYLIIQIAAQQCLRPFHHFTNFKDFKARFESYLFFVRLLQLLAFGLLFNE